MKKMLAMVTLLFLSQVYSIDWEHVPDPSDPLKVAYLTNVPKFEPISGIKGVKRAVNTSPNLIVIEFENLFYFYKVGWHVGTTEYGPWKPTEFLPDIFKQLTRLMPAEYLLERSGKKASKGMFYHGNKCDGTHHTHSPKIVKGVSNDRDTQHRHIRNYQKEKK